MVKAQCQSSRSASRPHLLFFISCLVCLAATCASPKDSVSNSSELTVAAAADLTNAFEELGREFQKVSNTKVIFSFGSSGLLTKQIENGAPIDLFAAANVDYINQLEQKGLVISETKKLYARGRIIIWTSNESPIKIEKLADLAHANVKRVAIANPEHAPYGMAARQALEAVGLWATIRPKLVYGENVRQTLQYAQTGNVEVAIVALSLTPQAGGQWVLIPEELHKPIDQALVVMKDAKNRAAAIAFTDFIFSDQGQAIMKRYGFTKAE
jgi:molybdate transport system substrate-binding protein